MAQSLRRSFRALALVLLVAAVLGVLWARHNTRDRNPGYRLDLLLRPGSPELLQVGFAALPITPEVPDEWTDSNGNARFERGELTRDGNGNGRFDPVWLAGFHNGRAAAGVHDDLWARALVVDDGRVRVALVVLDAIGLMHDQVLEVRRRIPREPGVDYAIVCSTHSHQAPDLMGLWGARLGQSGVDPAYLERVIEQSARSVEQALKSRRPARLRFAQISRGAEALVEDSRLPRVLDPDLRVMQAVDAGSGQTLGTLIAWANHPETAWSGNLQVSSDYPHALREGVERGVRDGDRLVAPGLGGVAIFVNGAIGGLMTTRPGFAVRDPFRDFEHREPGFEKARAQGQRLALLVLEALAGEEVAEVAETAIALRARAVAIPLENRLLQLGAALGRVQRSFLSWGAVRSEVAALRIGPASFLAVPGEIYPEIVNGGIESPPGADFPGSPVEVPPLRAQMPGEFRFVMGQANDALGYIIPRSEWDDEAPWIYGAEEETYGEIVSLGPGTAPLLHAELSRVIAELPPLP